MANPLHCFSQYINDFRMDCARYYMVCLLDRFSWLWSDDCGRIDPGVELNGALRFSTLGSIPWIAPLRRNHSGEKVWPKQSACLGQTPGCMLVVPIWMGPQQAPQSASSDQDH